MRKAFTLIELLVIVAIIAVMVTIAVVSVQKAQQSARLKSTVRTVFATMRQARSVALVSQEPVIVTFSSKRVDEVVKSKIEITSAKLLNFKNQFRARSIYGEWRTIGEDDGQTNLTNVPDESTSQEKGLFEPIDEEVLEGICIKVVVDEEDDDVELDQKKEANRSMISAYSNVDFLLGKYKEQREKAKSEEKKKALESSPEQQISSEQDITEDVSLVWHVNGRCKPLTIYIYPDDGSIENAWQIRVDRFGAIKVVAEEDD